MRAKGLGLCFFCVALALPGLGGRALGRPNPQQQTSPQAAAKPIGVIKVINGRVITLASDAGTTFRVTVTDATRLMRIEPGAKDLKNATPIQSQDLQAGDRILALGKISDDGHSVAASLVVVMKRADVASSQEQERQEWQRRGVGGLVSGTDLSAGTITISVMSLAGPKSLILHISRNTILLRYAPDSIKFEDAKPGTIEQIKTGDQLRARGTRSADGSEMAADEVVSGSFRNIAGTISSIDTSENTVTIMDLGTKKLAIVRISSESQLRRLPPAMAQFLAMRLKGGSAGSMSGPAAKAGEIPPSERSNAQSPASNSAANGEARLESAGRRGERTGGGTGDLSQMLTRVPAITLGSLQRGDAVMIVSTEGGVSGAVTAITLVAGVEPILEASPNGNGRSMILPPWSLSEPAEDAAP